MCEQNGKNRFLPCSGRGYREDGIPVNWVELLEAILKKLEDIEEALQEE